MPRTFSDMYDGTAVVTEWDGACPACGGRGYVEFVWLSGAVHGSRCACSKSVTVPHVSMSAVAMSLGKCFGDYSAPPAERGLK